MHGKVLEHVRVYSGSEFGADVARPGAGGEASGDLATADAVRLSRLRFVEERLRPLRGTGLARVYWRVVDELRRFEDGDVAEGEETGFGGA